MEEKHGEVEEREPHGGEMVGQELYTCREYSESKRQREREMSR